MTLYYTPKNYGVIGNDFKHITDKILELIHQKAEEENQSIGIWRLNYAKGNFYRGIDCGNVFITGSFWQALLKVDKLTKENFVRNIINEVWINDDLENSEDVFLESIKITLLNNNRLLWMEKIGNDVFVR